MTNREMLKAIFPEAHIEVLSGDMGALYMDQEWLDAEYVNVGSQTCKNCKYFHCEEPILPYSGDWDSWCCFHNGDLVEHCSPDYYCADFEKKDAEEWKRSDAK